MSVVKKTVAIYPVIDSYIRKVWSGLIERRGSASYSSALGFMLLIAIGEALSEDGIGLDTSKFALDLLANPKKMGSLNQEELLWRFQERLNRALSPR